MTHIMAKRNGKVTAVKSAGLASWYRGTPYVSTTSWNTPVNLFVRKYVGGVGQSPTTVWMNAGWTPEPLCAACTAATT